MLLRRGDAGSNPTADHIPVIRPAPRQLPRARATARAARSVRVDGAGATHELLNWLTARRLFYSVGFGLPGTADAMKERGLPLLVAPE